MLKNKPPFKSTWYVLLPICLGTSLSLLGDSALYTVLPTQLPEAGILLASVGIILSANRWVRLLTNNVVGWASDRTPRRWLFVPALFMGAFSTAVYALTFGFWPLFFGRILWGIAWSGIWVSGHAIIYDVTDESNRGRWMGYYHTSFFFGAGLGPPLIGGFTDWLGYRPAMGIASGLTLVGAFIALVWLPETRKIGMDQKKMGDHEIETAVAQAEAPTRWGEFISTTALLGLNRLVVAGILLSTLSFYLSQKWGNEINLSGRTLGITTITGLGIGLSTLLSTFSAAAAGRISDWMGNRWLIVVFSLILGAAGFVLLAFGATWMILIGLPFISLASGSNQSLAATLVGDVSGNQHRGRFLGIFYTVGDLTSAIGPPLAYGIIGLGQPANSVYWLSAGATGLLLLTAVYWSRNTIRNCQAVPKV